MRAVAEQGYTIPTPIQAQAIPFILAGRDLLGAAQTGTGKTAGFTLPMLQRLAEIGAQGATGKQAIRALVLVPTRELAAQVHESVRNYGKHMQLRSAMIFGGVGFNPQASETAPRRRHRRRHARPAARPRAAAHDRPAQRRNPGARRSRPHARHGLHPRHPPHHRAAAGGAAEPDVLRDFLGRHPQAFGLDPARSGEGRSRAPQRSDRTDRAIGLYGRPRSQARAARAPRQDRRLAAGAGVLQDQARRQPPRRSSSKRKASRPTPSTATRASRRAPRRSSASRTTSCRCWSPPTSPRAAWTSKPCRTW